MIEFNANAPVCVECHEPFTPTLRKQGGGRYQIYCSPRCRSNSWARGNTEKRVLSVIKYERKPESINKKRERSRRKRFDKYGLTESLVLEILGRQKSLCLGCSKKLDLNSARIDHCHKIEKEEGRIVVRGLLCDSCNWALGHAKDSPEILLNLARYLSEKQTLLSGEFAEQEDSCSR